MRALLAITSLLLPACATNADGLPCDPADRIIAFRDNDGDGFGRAVAGTVCALSSGQVTNSLDCNDDDAGINPQTVEVCDDVDNNCNGRVDEGFEPVSWFPDDDGDGFGSTSAEWLTCIDPGDGWTDDGTDCDDGDALVSPGQIEDCENGIDDDCSGEIDDGIEVCDDGIDNDCDDIVDCDDVDCRSFSGCQVCDDFTLVSATVASAAGSTVGQTNDFSPSCGSSNAADHAYEFVAPVTGTYTIDTFGSDYDTVLAVWDSCPPEGSEITCNDDAMNLQSQVSVSLDAGELIIIVVTGFSANVGNYQLSLALN